MYLDLGMLYARDVPWVRVSFLTAAEIRHNFKGSGRCKCNEVKTVMDRNKHNLWMVGGAPQEDGAHRQDISRSIYEGLLPVSTDRWRWSCSHVTCGSDLWSAGRASVVLYTLGVPGSSLCLRKLWLVVKVLIIDIPASHSMARCGKVKHEMVTTRFMPRRFTTSAEFSQPLKYIYKANVIWLQNEL